MKKLYFLTILLAVCFTNHAQTFVYSTEQHIDETLTAPYSTFGVEFTTAVPQAITYGWESVSNTLPSGWDISLCDYTGCYVGVPSSGTMTAITLPESQNGTEGFIKLTVGHQEIIGEGTVEIYVFDSNDHSIGDTISFHLVNGTASNHEIASNEPFKIYPNPTKDHLTIKGTGTYSGAIYNSLGQSVLSFKRSGLSTINVSNLRKGVYIIKYSNAFGKTFNKRLIIK
ncbi:MAG: T9SS type A sorting domain-containing protein [Crocinitomicaceae bacterium]|nr:T9SS type A sorting domain-containing protein [Crocinitomicaceae bacterium]